MQIIYGGTTIGNDPPQGTIGVLGFALPRAGQNIEWIEALRGADAYPVSRGNRKRTLEGSVFPAGLSTYALALLARVQFYEKLPASGSLLLIQDGAIVTFAQAVLQDIGLVEEVTMGVSFGLKFSFLVGPPTFTTATYNLTDSTGANLTDSGGGAINTSH